MKRVGYIMKKRNEKEVRGIMNPVEMTPCICAPYGDGTIQVRYGNGNVFYMPCDQMNVWYRPLGDDGWNMVVMTNEEA